MTRWTLVAALCSAALLAGCKREPARPNVLLISIDMLRADHVHALGYARATTPNIDRLANEGACFEQHVSSSSWTLPAHAALFTGLNDVQHGVVDTHLALGPEALTLAERFKAAGYETAGFFAGPYLHPAFGFGQGFERYVNCTSYAGKLDGAPSSAWSMDKDVMRESHADVTNPRVFQRFQEWIGQHDPSQGGRPFFAFLHLWDAHFDFVPPAPYDTRFDPDYKGSITGRGYDGRGFFFDERIAPGMDARDLEHLIALYDGEIAWTDEHVGKVRAELERLGLLENTLVVITSDHGTEFFEHGRKGHRQSLYDEVVRVPLVMRLPEHLAAGARIGEQTRSIDVVPTILELCGLPAPLDVAGQSLMPLVRKDPGARPARAILELDSVGAHLRAVRAAKWKFVDVIGSDQPFYFDLEKDPRELSPLTDRETELGKRATQAYLTEVEGLEAWLRAHPAPATSSQLPADVQHNLRHEGYIGGGDEDAPPPK